MFALSQIISQGQACSKWRLILKPQDTEKDESSNPGSSQLTLIDESDVRLRSFILREYSEEPLPWLDGRRCSMHYKKTCAMYQRTSKWNLYNKIYQCDTNTKHVYDFYRTRVRSLGMLVTNSLTNWLTHWLLFSKVYWCDPGVWRCQLKTCWGCYCCWCW